MGSINPLMKRFCYVLLTLDKSDKIFELLYVRIIGHLDSLEIASNTLKSSASWWHENCICMSFFFKEKKTCHFSESLVDLTFWVKDENLILRGLISASPLFPEESGLHVLRARHNTVLQVG